jgi:hypothetical protein
MPSYICLQVQWWQGEQLDLCIEARNLCAVVWSIILNQEHLDPKKDEWIQTRLGWFRERDNF